MNCPCPNRNDCISRHYCDSQDHMAVVLKRIDSSIQAEKDAKKRKNKQV